MECVYASGSQTPLHYGFPTPNTALGIDLAAFVQDLPATSFDFLPELFPLPSDSNRGVLGCGEQYPDGLTPVDPSRPSSTNLSSYPTIPLLSPEQKIQLMNEFFDRSHHLLPCIHKETILNRSRGSQGPVLSMPLEWAILAAAARTTRGAMVSRADTFLKTAVDSLAQSPIIQVGRQDARSYFPRTDKMVGECPTGFAGSCVVCIFALSFWHDCQGCLLAGPGILPSMLEWIEQTG